MLSEITTPVQANTKGVLKIACALLMFAPIEKLIYAIISAATSDFQASPTEVTSAGARNLNSVGNIRCLKRFKNGILKIVHTSLSSVSTVSSAEIVLSQIRGKTIITATTTASIFPFIKDHKSIINDATGVDFKIAMKGAKSDFIRENPWQNVPITTPNMKPIDNPPITLSIVATIVLQKLICIIAFPNS